MAKGKLRLKGNPDTSGRRMVYAYFTHQGQETFILTPERINPAHLVQNDSKEGRLRLTKEAPNYKHGNIALINLEDSVRSVVERFRYQKPSGYTVLDIREEFLLTATWKDGVTQEIKYWLHTFDEWMEYKKATGMEVNTLRTYQSTRNELAKWLDDAGLGKIALHEFTKTMFNDHLGWMYKKGYEPSMISKRRSQIANWCHWAKHPDIDKDWKPDRRIKRLKKMVHFMTEDEVMKLYNYVPENEGLQAVKDIFFRMVSSGVRWSDRHLEMAQVVELGGREYLQKRNMKNGNISSIPITYMLRESLEKKLPPVTQQHFNRLIKLLCKSAGIDAPVIKIKSKKGGGISEEIVPKHEVISSKVGRKTVASLLRAAGLSSGEVKGVLGNTEELDAYDGVDLKNVSDKMGVFLTPASSIPSLPLPTAD